MKNNKPEISVIIPSYNHVKFITEAINSVLNQTFQNFELIIIDDGSQDNSAEVIKSFNDQRITFLVNETNKGAVYTTNKMVEMAQGKYIALLNSDDYWEPTKLEKQLEFMEGNPQYGAVFTNANIVKEDGTLFEDRNHFYSSIFEQPNRTRFEWLHYFFNVGNALCHPSLLIRKDVYNNVGLYNSLMASLPDFEMWVRVCLKYEIYVMSEKLVAFRILDNEQNASGMNPDNIIRCQFEYKHILDLFLSITENEYEKIFSESIEGNVAYSLALQAFKKDTNFMKDWALDLIYSQLKQGLDTMSHNEFVKLTKKNDIYNLHPVDVAFVQLYLDHGDGFKEEESLKLPIVQTTKTQELIFSLSDKQTITNLRLDPLNDSCVIEMESFHIKKNALVIDLVPYMHSNAEIHHSTSYFFATNDPQIYFNGLDASTFENVQSLVIVLRYVHIAKDAFHESVKRLRTELDNTRNSFSWKVTKPLRLLKKFI